MADNNNIAETVTNKLSEFTASIMPKKANEAEEKIFRSFMAELTDSDDAPPVYACRDAKYYLTLQREKMKSMGISISETVREAGALTGITGMMYDSPGYTIHRLFRGYRRKSVYCLDGKRIYTFKEQLTLYQTLVDAKKGISPEEKYLCPSCGGISSIAELENGCKFCGTRFLMSELFPKVTEHYWLHDYSMSKSDMKKRILGFSASGLAIGTVLGLLFTITNLWRKISPALNASEISAVIYFAISGVIFGAVASTVTLFAKVMRDAVKSIPLISRVSGTKRKLESVLKPRDPYYFYEAFESRILSLMKIMLYNNDISESSAYFGERPVMQSDVIEAVYRGAIEINRIEISGNYTYITLTVFADCLHLKGRKIIRKNDEYQMVVARNNDVVTDQNFSIIKVECPSCGGSFDASRMKRCPYCGREYHLFDHDWAVFSFEKRK